MITVYGLKNCDTCRKALKWLADSGIDHRFHDVRADGVTAADIGRWADAVSWETLLNRRGTTWRKLPDAVTAEVDAGVAVALMAEHPALIKRPVFARGSKILVGFTDAEKAALTAGG